jgi:tetratricopeptide (TPR) repeat protein
MEVRNSNEMQEQVLWAIDNVLDGRKFEQLCVDLLYRNGYQDIVPIEPQDGGRDAEELPRKGRDRDGCPSFFQFSKEAGWKAKIRKDAANLHRRGAKFTYLVFATSRKIRGIDIDELRAEFRAKYGWTLVIYSREWFRLQLEEANSDLSEKYLGIRILSKSKVPSWLIDPKSAAKSVTKQIMRAMEAGAYDRMIDLLRQFLDSRPESAVSWQLLAWAEYLLERYDESLADINRALKLLEEPRFKLVRACILAERGIRDHKKPELRIAESLFREGLLHLGDEGGMAHYNLANVLSALREFPEAIQQYKLALKREKNMPQIWKNLGSAYSNDGDKVSAMSCFDRALEFDPLLPEALSSKAILFITDRSKPQEAVPLLETAYRSQPAIATRWPEFWYWLTMACFEANELPLALKWVDEGLDHQPASGTLLSIKSSVLAKLQHTDPAHASSARSFWRSELVAEPRNYEARKQLALAENSDGNADEAWRLANECLRFLKLGDDAALQRLGLSVEQCFDALEFLPQYLRFRAEFPLARIWDPENSKAFSKARNLEAQKLLGAYLAIPFGCGYRQLSEHDPNLSRFFDAIRQPLIASFVATAFSFSPLIGAELGNADKMSSLTTAASALMANASQYEFSSQASWKPLLDGVDAETVSVELEAYPKLVVAMDVMTESLIAIMTPHLPHEGRATSKGKAPSRHAKKQTAKSSRKNAKKKVR